MLKYNLMNYYVLFYVNEFMTIILWYQEWRKILCLNRFHLFLASIFCCCDALSFFFSFNWHLIDSSRLCVWFGLFLKLHALCRNSHFNNVSSGGVEQHLVHTWYFVTITSFIFCNNHFATTRRSCRRLQHASSF